MSPDIAAKWQTPAVQKAIVIWARRVASLLLIGKSEAQVRATIQKEIRVPLSKHEMEIIWRSGIVVAEEIQKQSMPIIITNGHGDS